MTLVRSDGGTMPILAINLFNLTLSWGQFFDGIYKLAQFLLVVVSLAATYWLLRLNKAKAHNAESHDKHKKGHRSRFIDLGGSGPTD